jgi:hypothetical protein
MTYEEKRGPIRGRTVAWTGDANNVLASWMHAAERFDFQLRVATPAELRPKKWLMDWVKSSGAAISIGDDPDAAVKDADCVVTDTWVSMGDRDGKLRHNILKRYQVNARLMSKARPDALFMHCLPAHRGEEVTDEVIDGPQSVVFDEAENSAACPEGPAGLVLARRRLRRLAHSGTAHGTRSRIPDAERYIGLMTDPQIAIPSVRLLRPRSMTPSCPSKSLSSTCVGGWSAWASRGRNSRTPCLSAAGGKTPR